MSRVWLLCFLLTGCAGKTFEPSQLGIQFTGQWEEAPQIRVGTPEKNHVFLVRLTGYVPQRAEHVVILSPWGEMVNLPITWFDVGQTAPQRKYFVTWALSEAVFYKITQKNQPEDSDEMVFGAPDGMNLTLRAEVHTQDEQVLAHKPLHLTITCVSCGI